MRQEIFQDVERCMPENTYFRQPDTQNMMLDVLFIWTKLNPDVGYRQGMHELLAPVLWAVERDSIVILDSAPALHQIVDVEYVEHDTFTLFAEIMNSAKSYYDPAGIGSQMSSSPSANSESAMIIRSRRITQSFLMQYDPGLTAHLEELEILPQLFLMYGHVLCQQRITNTC
jgi:TBC1 domain family member 5